MYLIKCLRFECTNSTMKRIFSPTKIKVQRAKHSNGQRNYLITNLKLFFGKLILLVIGKSSRHAAVFMLMLTLLLDHLRFSISPKNNEVIIKLIVKKKRLISSCSNWYMLQIIKIFQIEFLGFGNMVIPENHAGIYVVCEKDIVIINQKYYIFYLFLVIYF